MSPRPYRLGQRQVANEQTRSRIINAARELLMAYDSFSTFSLDAVARRADVARATVYHQFGTKAGLLEALSDSLAASGGMEQLATVFRHPDPLDVLTHYILAFSRFWDADRLVTRRLRALAALDADFERVIRARDERRRQGVKVILQRLGEKQMLAPTQSLDEAADTLFTLISFETFDTLAGKERSILEVAPQVCSLVCTALHLKTK